MIKIASTVFDTKEIRLQDDKDVTLRPLPIALLKKAMAAWNKIADATDESGIFDVYIQCVGICLSREFKGEEEWQFAKPIQADGTLSKDYREYLDEIVDTPTAFEILEICMGLKLNDPNLTAEVAEALADGTT